MICADGGNCDGDLSAAALRAIEINTSGRCEEAADLAVGNTASDTWSRMCEAGYASYGIIVPAFEWSRMIVVMIQGSRTSEAAVEIQKRFGIDKVIIGLVDHIDTNNVVAEMTSCHLCLYINYASISGGFVTLRLVESLPMICHAYHVRRRDGGIQIGLGDQGTGLAAAFCSNNREVTLLPDPIFIESAGYYVLRQAFKQAPSFGSRHPRAFWRGSTTGYRSSTWRTLPRAILCEIGARNDHLFDCGLTSAVQSHSREEVDEIMQSGLVRDYVPARELMMHRHHIDIDGNSSSWPGLFSKLLSGGAVFKVTSPGQFRQWYYDRLIPWMHFIPVEAGMGDIVEKVQWALRNEEKVARIGAAGRRLADSMTLLNELDYAAVSIDARLA